MFQIIVRLRARSFDYSIYSYSGIGITEHTEYKLPKEQTVIF